MEEFDPNSQEHWEKKLTAMGMPEKLTDINPEEITVPKPETETTDKELSMLSEAMMNVLAQYSSLPPKIQKDILDDVYAKHNEGLPFATIANRVKILAQKGEELVKMPEDSDKYYRPKPSVEELKLNGETEKLIHELERIREEKEKKNIEEKKPKKEQEDAPEEPTGEGWVN